MSQLDLFVAETDDAIARENFDRIQLFFFQDLFTKFDGGFFTLSINGAVTNFKYPHRLGFRPLDIIETSRIGAGSVTWNYSEFDESFIDITTTGSVDLRFVAGVFVTGG